MRRAPVSAVLLGAVAVGTWVSFASAAAGVKRCTGDPLPVVVEEGREQVKLRIRLGERIDPGSLEIDLDGTRVSIAADEPESGRRLCSGDLWLRDAVVEEKALADYRDGWLTITLARVNQSDDAK